MKNFSATRLKNSLAVVAYANDANAWFPYFYSYYSGIFGESSIYIISPNPKSFVNYKLGGIVSVEGRSYCDVARSELISNVANGLKAYSEWTLVCDVDEIIVPNSVLGKSLKELIFGSTNNVIASWGLDVIQQGEPVFDFNKSIFQQRTIAVPNLALSKPHISRVPLRYSVGYHYCNIKTDESAMNGDLITLHLKFACAKIRAEVTTTVLKLDYADERTKDYSVNSVSDANVHPLIKRTGVRKIGLDAPETIEFFKQYVKNMRFDSINQIWYGQYKHADFFVKI